MFKRLSWLTLFAATTLSHGADIPWIDGDGHYTNSAKWVGGVAPAGEDNAVFTNLPGTATVTVDRTTTNLGVVFDTTNQVVLSIAPGTILAYTNEPPFVVGVTQPSQMVIMGGGTLRPTPNDANNGEWYVYFGSNAPVNLVCSNVTILHKKMWLAPNTAASGSTFLFTNCTVITARLSQGFQCFQGGTTFGTNSSIVVAKSVLVSSSIDVQGTSTNSGNLSLVFRDGTVVSNTSLNVFVNVNAMASAGNFVASTNRVVLITDPGTLFTNFSGAASLNIGGQTSSSGVAERFGGNIVCAISNQAKVCTGGVNIGHVLPVTNLNGITSNIVLSLDSGAFLCCANIYVGAATGALQIAKACNLNIRGSSMVASNLYIGYGSNATANAASFRSVLSATFSNILVCPNNSMAVERSTLRCKNLTVNRAP